jgi:hypothetical protein
MLDLIFALKFVHVLAAATMFGVWLCLAIVMISGHRSGNPSVVAVTMQFIVDVEKWVMAPAIAAQPVSGFPLAWAIGLSPLNEYRSFAAQRILDRGVARAVCDRRCVLACGFSHRDTCPRIEPAIGARGGRIANRLSPHVARLVRARSGPVYWRPSQFLL